MKSSIMPSSFALLVALLALLAVADNVLHTEARQFEGTEMSWDMKSSSEPDPDCATPRIRPLPINPPGQHNKPDPDCASPDIEPVPTPPKTSWDHLHAGQHNDVGKAPESSIELDLDRAKPRIKTLPYPPKGEQIHGGQHNDVGKAESSIDPDLDRVTPRIQPVPVPVPVPVPEPPVTSWDHLHGEQQERYQRQCQKVQGHCLDPKEFSNPPIHIHGTRRLKHQSSRHPVQIILGSATGGQHIDVGKPESSIEPNKGCMRPSPHCP